ncbi:unnamed protein product [Nesidiocoris tenuis]|uniref:BBS2 GAE domain-containing protein n=1 Tax=Nesidiocoris tenuis TaxID=355587 RepID=A0A6H5GT53_9HEMI|nr:unnamed protein product [Nesidiocoris tenuis]
MLMGFVLLPRGQIIPCPRTSMRKFLFPSPTSGGHLSRLVFPLRQESLLVQVPTVYPTEAGGHVIVQLNVNNMTVIRSATVFAEGIFQGETYVVHPRIDQVSDSLSIPLKPPKDTPLDIHIRLEQWQGQNFLVSPAAEREGSSRAAWILNLVSVRDKSPLLLKLEGSVMTVATPHMSVAADVIQSLANFFNLSSLQVAVLLVVDALEKIAKSHQ